MRALEVLEKGISASQVEKEETEEEIVVVRTPEAAALSRELREETTSSPESGGSGTEEAGYGVTKGVGDGKEEDERGGLKVTPAVTRSQTRRVGFLRDPPAPAGMIMVMARKDGIEDELEEEMCPAELPTCPVSELDTPKHVDEALGGPHARN